MFADRYKYPIPKVCNGPVKSQSNIFAIGSDFEKSVTPRLFYVLT
jgi:hypothetical protein